MIHFTSLEDLALWKHRLKLKTNEKRKRWAQKNDRIDLAMCSKNAAQVKREAS